MPDNLADMLELLRDALVRGNDGVEGIADLACDPDLMAGQPHRKISGLHRVQRIQQLMLVKLRGSSVAVHSGLARAAFTRGVSRFAQSIAGFCAGISSFAAITSEFGVGKFRQMMLLNLRQDKALGQRRWRSRNGARQ